MELDEKKIELLEKIEKYLDGILPESERTSFERQMKENPELADEVHAYRAINFAIGNRDYVQLKNELLKTKEVIEDVRRSVSVDYGAETAESPVRETARKAVQTQDTVADLFEKIKQFLFPTPQRPVVLTTGHSTVKEFLFPAPALRLALAVATVVVLLIPAYILFFSGPNTERLYADNFTPYPNTITASRSEGEENLGDLDKAMLLYEGKDYEKSLSLLNNYLAANPAQYDVVFYRGIANLELGNIQQALADFKQVMENNPRLENQAKWYTALLYLKNSQTDEAVKILKEIRQQENAYSEKAEVILKKLKK